MVKNKQVIVYEGIYSDKFNMKHLHVIILTSQSHIQRIEKFRLYLLNGVPNIFRQDMLPSHFLFFIVVIIYLRIFR